MYRLIINNKVVKTIESITEYTQAVAVLYSDGLVTSTSDVSIHADDIDLFNKERLSLSIDLALIDVDLTAREQRVITANGALLALFGVARLIKHINSPDDVANNTEILNWGSMADAFINANTQSNSLLSVLGMDKIISDITTYTTTTGTIVKSEKDKLTTETQKDIS